MTNYRQTQQTLSCNENIKVVDFQNITPPKEMMALLPKTNGSASMTPITPQIHSNQNCSKNLSLVREICVHWPQLLANYQIHKTCGTEKYLFLKTSKTTLLWREGGKRMSRQNSIYRAKARRAKENAIRAAILEQQLFYDIIQ